MSTSLVSRVHWTSVLRRCAFTIGYGLIIIGTSTFLHSLSANRAQEVLEANSTNLAHLTGGDLRVLVSSMFWVENLRLALLIGLVVMAWVEWSLNSFRVVMVFAVGHIGATLISVAGLALAIRHHVADLALERAIDVGASYGLLCVTVTAIAILFINRQRKLAAALAIVVTASVVSGLVETNSFTDWGHLAAALLGLALWPVVRRWHPGPPTVGWTRPALSDDFV